MIPLQRTESVEGERRREGHRPEELEKDGSPQAGHGSAGERGLGHSQVLRWRMLGPGPGAQTGDSRAKQIFFFFFFYKHQGNSQTSPLERKKRAKLSSVWTRGGRSPTAPIPRAARTRAPCPRDRDHGCSPPPPAPRDCPGHEPARPPYHARRGAAPPLAQRRCVSAVCFGWTRSSGRGSEGGVSRGLGSVSDPTGLRQPSSPVPWKAGPLPAHLPVPPLPTSLSPGEGISRSPLSLHFSSV